MPWQIILKALFSTIFGGIWNYAVSKFQKTPEAIERQESNEIQKPNTASWSDTIDKL